MTSAEDLIKILKSGLDKELWDITWYEEHLCQIKDEKVRSKLEKLIYMSMKHALHFRKMIHDLQGETLEAELPVMELREFLETSHKAQVTARKDYEAQLHRIKDKDIKGKLKDIITDEKEEEYTLRDLLEYLKKK